MKRFIPLAACAALLALGACQDAPTAPATSPEAAGASATVRTGWIHGPDNEPLEVRYSVIDGMSILEGDINLGPAGSVARTREELTGRRDGPRAGVAINGYRWPSGYVPYAISSSFSANERQTILNAIAHVQNTTAGTQFVQRTSQGDYISFVPHGSLCNSPVGRRGGAQTINLAAGCSTSLGTVAHEILHSLGVWHEQSRCDRDNFVTINLANVQPGFEHNFDRKCSGNADILGYSEGSVMHYDPWAFSRNGLPTITSRRGLDWQMGQRTGLSQSDVSTLNTMYRPWFPQNVSVTDQGGFPQVAWSAANGATSYTIGVIQVYDHWNDWLGTHESSETWVNGGGSGASPSVVDVHNAYTGTSVCTIYVTYTESAQYSYVYEVVNWFPDGISSYVTRHPAPIAPSSC